MIVGDPCTLLHSVHPRATQTEQITMAPTRQKGTSHRSLPASGFLITTRLLVHSVSFIVVDSLMLTKGLKKCSPRALGGKKGGSHVRLQCFALPKSGDD